MGTAWNAVFSYYVLPPDASAMSKILSNGALAFSWYIVLQLVLAWVCGLFKHAGHRAAASIVTMILNLKCWAVMLGIITGATSMGFFSSIQDLGKDSCLWVVSMPVAAFCMLGALYYVGDSIRTQISKMDDDTIDMYEFAWDKYTDQTEDMVVALTVGHLTVQASRYVLTGTLPLPSGDIRPGTEVEHSDVWTLAGSSLIYITLIVMVQLWSPPHDATFKVLLRRRGAQILANCTAFALFYSTTWYVTEVMTLTGPASSLLTALGVTLIGFALLLLLDFLADLECTGERFDQSLQQMVVPISVLVGFGWKGAFAAAGTTLVQDVSVLPAPLEQLILAVILLLVICPAWRMYILPVVMLEELRMMKRKRGELVSKTTVEGKAHEEMMDSQVKHAFHKVEDLLDNTSDERKMEAYLLELERLHDSLRAKYDKTRTIAAKPTLPITTSQPEPVKSKTTGPWSLMH